MDQLRQSALSSRHPEPSGAIRSSKPKGMFMRFHPKTTLPFTAVALAAMVSVAAPASAQVTHETQEHHSTSTNTTVPGNVSTNKVKTVHIKKHVAAPAKPAPGSAVHTTVTKTEHRSASSQSGH
jgi:hypothetical protein